jgi:hypothetical protein
MNFKIGDKVIYNGTAYSDYRNKNGVITKDNGESSLLRFIVTFNNGDFRVCHEDNLELCKNKIVQDIIKDL